MPIDNFTVRNVHCNTSSSITLKKLILSTILAHKLNTCKYNNRIRSNFFSRRNFIKFHHLNQREFLGKLNPSNTLKPPWSPIQNFLHCFRQFYKILPPWHLRAAPLLIRKIFFRTVINVVAFIIIKRRRHSFKHTCLNRNISVDLTPWKSWIR